MSSEVRAPSWGVVLACVALAAWLALAHAAAVSAAAPRRAVPSRRPRYIGAHTRRRKA